MKVIYWVIKEWSSLLGVHYDDINGADIRDEASAKVFEEWCHEKVSYGPLSIYLANSRERHGYWLPTMGCGYGYLWVWVRVGTRVPMTQGTHTHNP